MKDKKKLINKNEYIAMMLKTKYPQIAYKQIDFYKYDKITFDEKHNKHYINSGLPSFPGKSWDRFHKNINDIAEGKRRLLYLDIVITGRCHCHCWHCFRYHYKNKRDLDKDRIKLAIKDAYDLGAVMIGITGGEPTLRQDLADIINFIPQGMEAQLYTTGYKIDENFIEKIENSNLTRCIISLDDYRRENVKNTRGYKNAYEDTIKAIELLNQA